MNSLISFSHKYQHSRSLLAHLADGLAGQAGGLLGAAGGWFAVGRLIALFVGVCGGAVVGGGVWAL